jgi:hypothetical protein
MPSPQRSPSGISTATRGTVLWDYPRPDPTKVYQYFNDFDTYVAGDWTVTEINDATQALEADAPFGALKVTLAGADNDGSQAQLTTETFTLAIGKKAWFKSRFKISDATQSDFAIGLIILDTTILGSVDSDGATDGIFFSKEDGDTALDISCQKDTTTGQLRATSIATVADDTYLTVGFEFDGKRYIRYFVNDVQKGSLDLTPLSPVSGAATDYLPNTPVTVSYALLAGEAEATTFHIDYLFAAIER